MFNDRYGLTNAVIEGRKIMTRRLIDPMPKDCAITHKNCWGAYWSDEPMSLVVDRDTGGIYCQYCGNGVRLHDGGYHYKTKYKVGEVVAVAQTYFGTYDESKWENGSWYNEFEDSDDIVNHAGWTNKMFVKAEYMPPPNPHHGNQVRAVAGYFGCRVFERGCACGICEEWKADVLLFRH